MNTWQSQIERLILKCMSPIYMGGVANNLTTADCWVPQDVGNCATLRNEEIGLLLTGVVTSRMGLWMFDLAVTQMLQERVPLSLLGAVNGTQSSMQELMDLLGYVLGLLLSHPAQFKYLVRWRWYLGAEQERPSHCQHFYVSMHSMQDFEFFEI